MLIPKLSYTPVENPTGTNYLNDEGEFTPPAGGGGGVPGGLTTQIQFNSAGAFAGSANLTYDPTGNGKYTLFEAMDFTYDGVNGALYFDAAAAGQSIVLNSGLDSVWAAGATDPGNYLTAATYFVLSSSFDSAVFINGGNVDGSFQVTQLGSGAIASATLEAGAGAQGIALIASSNAGTMNVPNAHFTITGAPAIAGCIAGTVTNKGMVVCTNKTARAYVDNAGNWQFNSWKATTSKSVQTPATGFTITIAAEYLLLNPAGTLATGTINMPASPIDGQLVTVSSSQIITSLTVSGNGHTILNAPTTLAAGGRFAYIYNTATTTWYVA